jgi:hypothetical protein
LQQSSEFRLKLAFDGRILQGLNSVNSKKKASKQDVGLQVVTMAKKKNHVKTSTQIQV